MYECEIKVNPTTIFHIKGQTPAEVWEQLARVEEIFASETKCFLCGSGIRHVVRENKKKQKFFELHCMDAKCRARFAFGQHQTPQGSLFPQRKTRDGKYKPNNGWDKWVPGQKDEDEG